MLKAEIQPGVDPRPRTVIGLKGDGAASPEARAVTPLRPMNHTRFSQSSQRGDAVFACFVARRGVSHA